LSKCLSGHSVFTVPDTVNRQMMTLTSSGLNSPQLVTTLHKNATKQLYVTSQNTSQTQRKMH